MKDGRIVVEPLKLSSVARHQGLVEPGMVRVMYGSEPHSPWMAKEYGPSSSASRPEPTPSKSREKRIVADPVEDPPREDGAKTLCVPGPSARKAVPTLRNKTLKVSARVPRLLPVKLSPQSKKGVEEPMKLEAAVEARPLPIPDAVPEFERLDTAPAMDSPMETPTMNFPSEGPQPAEFPSGDIPPHVQVKVIPTPKKRGPRSLASEEEPSAPPVTKPLKVIRKRREQEPKVFETAPKPVPQAMLEGIKRSQENGDQAE